MNVIAQVGVLFILMLCGFSAAKFRWIDERGFDGLNSVVLNFSMPALIIAKLQQSTDPSQMRDMASVFVLGGLSIILCGVLARFLVFRRSEARRRAVLSNMCMFSNSGFMGFPVLAAAFGEDKLIYGVVYVGIFNLLCWSVGIMVFDRHALDLRGLLKIPTLIASALGLVLFVASIRLPGVLVSAMEMMGDTTTPLAMFIVGSRLTQLRLGDLKDGELLLACALRLLIFPLAVYALTGLLGAAKIVRDVVTLCTAMPCAASLVIQAKRYGGDSAFAARAIATSTMLSVVSIPLILLLI